MQKKLACLAYALVTHSLYLVSIVVMILSIGAGMRHGVVHLSGPSAWMYNAILVLQFPLLHSYFLSAKGRKLLGGLIPGQLGRDLSTTTYVLVSSIQLLLTFFFWAPSGAVWWHPGGGLAIVMWAIYGLSWLSLGCAIMQGGCGVQLGYLGWLAVIRGQRPIYPSFSQSGMYCIIRHPIYLSFFIALLSAPIWTPDRILLAAVWCPYTLLAPILKERRYLEFYGKVFSHYRASTPYMLPQVVHRKRT